MIPAVTKRENMATKKAFGGLDKKLLINMHKLMVKSRVLEERLIKIYRAGESFFWIGGPGEEAWGVPLGLLGKKGQGPAYDYYHLHYRCTPTLIALGLPMIDSVRLMMNRSTDKSTGGRNFSNHYCIPEWNVAPVTSPLEVQYPIACGTAHVQKRLGKKAITIVTGGDAGTAEGDFASSLILASRKGQELPMLITVQNNKWGISTSYDGQHGETHIADRAKAFNIKSRVINGNDPVESYICLQEDMAYIRKTGKPAFIEAHLSRLYGHSSASGANPVPNEVDPVREFEKKLLKAGILKEKDVKELWQSFENEGVKAAEQARQEPVPTAESVWDHTFVGSENADWRNF
ncbi:3-methyl-2-oxobutanoate dehydrogenase [Pseudobdellovibrio exovorus JSS]|uniref:2-oxoisovalerate dehydrogenase subunit alpha n=2 Tax=Pseudobdellovibrio exovorus TaxID=453816 RepID=M4V6M8_9BACT|nr:3-methyl-2-oxobutanoate dehydrogenase [Pseudobdellovibrio exovorus JSS]